MTKNRNGFCAKSGLRVIIDTNIYIALERGDERAIKAISGRKMLFLPVFVVAELRFGFINGTKQRENEKRLERFLAHSHSEVLYPSLETTKHYSQIAAFCKYQGRALSHNDMWIAALVTETGLPFVTFDKDFVVLERLVSDLHIIN